MVLNLIPDRPQALRDPRRIVRPAGIEFMHAFWAAANALDPKARDFAEDRRFSFCTGEGLTKLAREAGLDPEVIAIEAPSVFRGFDDF